MGDVLNCRQSPPFPGLQAFLGLATAEKAALGQAPRRLRLDGLGAVAELCRQAQLLAGDAREDVMAEAGRLVEEMRLAVRAAELMIGSDESAGADDPPERAFDAAPVAVRVPVGPTRCKGPTVKRGNGTTHV
jgi:hypothetical protein